MYSTNFNKIVLLLNAFAFLTFGFWLFRDPAALSMVGVTLSTPDAFAEIRAMYGGLELGMGAFLLVCWKKNWMNAGITASLLFVLGLAVARTLAYFMDGAGDTILKFFVIEWIAVVVNGIAWWKGQREK